MLNFNGAIDVFITCPQSRGLAASDYLRVTREVAAWGDEAGCTGMLIYTDNGIVDPWLVAQATLQSTRQLSPLVAVQPVYMHPYSAAKMVSSLAFLHGRRIHLNMLAGGFRNDLVALGDTTPHDDRYARTIEYTLIMRGLLEADLPVNFQGRYYEVQNLRMTPPLPADLFPGLLISGSSEAGRKAAAAIGATAVEYPKPQSEGEAPGGSGMAGRQCGFRVGIIARGDAEEAWRIAFQRFPEDRRGRLAHQIAMKTSDSLWHRQLSELAAERAGRSDPYWLWPFETYGTFCPYLVGDFETVSEQVAGYLRSGATSFILDIPREASDLESTGIVFRRALQKVAGNGDGAALPAA